MVWRPKNVRESGIILRTVTAIMGHGVFDYPIGRQHPKFSSTYAIIISLLYCIVLRYTVELCVEVAWFDPTEDVYWYIVYTNVAIAGLSQILSWYYAKTNSRIVEKIATIDETLRELGSPTVYDRIFHSEILTVVVGLIAVIGLNMTEISWLSDVLPPYQIAIITSVLYHPIHMNAIVVCNFSMGVRYLGMRFRKTNEVLESIATLGQLPISDRAWQCLASRSNTQTFALSTRRLLNNALDRKHVIQIIKHVHLELCTISKDFNRAYGVQVALEITAYFVTFTGSILDFYYVIRNPTVANRNLRILIIVVWIIAYFAKLMLINCTCGSTSTEAHRTGLIIHRIHESVGDSDVLDDIRQFSLQIIQHPLHFKPVGLFTLGSEFVVGFIGTVLTYVAIFLQMQNGNVSA